MLDAGIVRRSTSLFISPAHFVSKADGSLRLVIDYRALNAVTKPLHFPLPRVADILGNLAGAKRLT
jgi:hypothetical protein